MGFFLVFCSAFWKGIVWKINEYLVFTKTINSSKHTLVGEPRIILTKKQMTEDPIFTVLNDSNQQFYSD